MKINTQYSMSLDNNCFSEFNNWLRDIEVKGINNIMLFLTWPGKELQNSQQDLFSAMSEFIIYNNFWLSPIVSTFRYIILNKVNSLCLCEKSVDLFPDVSQLSYKEAFTFFKLLDVEEIRKILNVYCNSSFMFNTILDAIEKNDYNLFLEALANANHKQLMQYLSLLKMVSFEINNKGYIDNWGTVNDFQVFFWDTNFDCKERLIDIFSHPKELFLFPELYLSPTRYSSIKSFINPLDIIEAFNKSNKPEYLSQYCLYKDFINNISKELSNKEKCKKSIELLDEKLLSKQCRKWCYIIIRESIFTRLDELGFVPSKNKVYNDDDNNRETPNYVKRISDLEEKKNVISLTELREKLLRNNPDLSKITIPSDNNNEEDPKILYELRQALEKISKFTLESLDKIKEVFDEISTILHPEKITNTFKMYILFYTSKVYHIYCSIKPLLTEQDSSVLEWYLNSSEYFKWYNNVMFQSNETDHRISISNFEGSKQSPQEEAGNSLSNIPTINCNDTDLSDEKMVERLKAVYLKTLNRRKNLQDHKLIIPLVKFLQDSYFNANFGEIAYVIFNSGSIKPSKKLKLINDVKSFILFISYLFNRKIPKEVWAYLGYYIVDSDGKPIFPIDINDMEYKENPIRGRYRSEDLKNYHKEIQKGIIRYLKADEEYLLKEINQIK